MNKKLIIFDVDGVLFDSKKNMSFAWKKVKSVHKVKPDFKNYFKFVGLPFNKILFKLNIKKNLKEIEKTYRNESLRLLSKNILYPGVKKTLKRLRIKYKLAIVTSKDKTRTKKILKEFNLKFKVIISPSKNLKGKPYPDQILKALKLSRIKNKKNAVYVGDTKIDCMAAKNSGINYVHAKYGFQIKRFPCKHNIEKFNLLPKVLNGFNF